jgi:hypothetical protein
MSGSKASGRMAVTYNFNCPADKSRDSLPNGYSLVTRVIASSRGVMPSKQGVAGSSPVSRSKRRQLGLIIFY